MSSATAIPLSAELKSVWGAQRGADGDARVLRVAITNEECVLQDVPLRVVAGTSKEQDFNALLAIVAPSDPVYLLFREQGAQWIFIAFIPDNAKISEKLVYAATTHTAKRLLGEEFFVDETHMSVLSELSWSAYSSSRKSVPCQSEREAHIQQLDEMEAQARKEQEADAREKAAEPPPRAESPSEKVPPLRQPITPKASASSPAAAATTAAPKPKPAAATATAKPVAKKPAAQQQSRPLPAPTAVAASARVPAEDAPAPSGGVGSLRRAFESGDASQLSQAQQPARASPSMALDGERGMKLAAVGGYHTVKLPFTADATSALRKIPQGMANFVELKIENEQVCLVSTDTVSATQLSSRINQTEPRFIFYAFRHTRAGGSERTCTLFIYSCPEKSRPKLRMVYSTSKPNIAQEAQAAGIVIGRKLEIRSAEEASQHSLMEALYPTYTPPTRTTAMAASAHTVSVPHPVYSKIAGDSHPGGMRKKIVIPPSGAW